MAVGPDKDVHETMWRPRVISTDTIQQTRATPTSRQAVDRHQNQKKCRNANWDAKTIEQPANHPECATRARDSFTNTKTSPDQREKQFMPQGEETDNPRKGSSARCNWRTRGLALRVRTPPFLKSVTEAQSFFVSGMETTAAFSPMISSKLLLLLPLLDGTRPLPALDPPLPLPLVAFPFYPLGELTGPS